MQFKYENRRISRLIEYLGPRYPKGQLVCVSVVNGVPAVNGTTGSGFGVYVRCEGVKHPTILIAGEAPQEFIDDGEEREFFCKVFLHEFRHHLQYEEFSENVLEDWAEDDANEFADEEYTKFIEWCDRLPK